MLFDGMLALAGVAVVDHARSARGQSKGSGPGLVPLRTHPRSWGEGGVRALLTHPRKITKAKLEVRISITTHGAHCQTVGHNKWWMQ